jgi:hypothetical protein
VIFILLKKSKGDKIPISVSLGMKKKQIKRQKRELDEVIRFIG